MVRDTNHFGLYHVPSVGLTSEGEGQYRLRLLRPGKHQSPRVRRAPIVMTSTSGATVPAIDRLVAADEDTAREVIHAFNEEGRPA
jgi:hypothetical protein